MPTIRKKKKTMPPKKSAVQDLKDLLDVPAEDTAITNNKEDEERIAYEGDKYE